MDSHAGAARTESGFVRSFTDRMPIAAGSIGLTFGYSTLQGARCTLARHLVFRGSIVLLIGLACGAPYRRVGLG